VSEAVPPLGTLTDRVVLKGKITTDEDEGGATVVYSTLATVWARVRSLGTRQSFESDARGQSVSHSVVMRFRTDLKAGDRIIYRGRDLEVLGTSDLNGRRAYLSCQCAERVVTG
jgi:SPP1 family predicted phage head-tail adaptor